MDEFEKQLLQELKGINFSLEILASLVQVAPVDGLGNKKPILWWKETAKAGFDANYDIVDYLKDLSNKRNAKAIELELKGDE